MYNDIRHSSLFLSHHSQSKAGLLPFPDTLYVVTPIINSQRYARRYELYRAFEKHIKDSGAELYTAELAFGDREFEVTERNNPSHFQFRTKHEIWFKENLINAAIARLPPEAKYIAWVDADITFSRPDWVQETLHQLQHNKFVQLFSSLVQLNHSSEVLTTRPSFMAGWEKWNNELRKLDCSYPCPYMDYPNGGIAGGPGLAWAARKEALDEVGGLIDYAILGSADYHMAAGLMGAMDITLAKDYSEGYKKMLFDWQEKALEHIKKDVGMVKGVVLHHWHGSLQNRGYGTRWKILVKHGFNPETDLKRDHQGLWQLTDKKTQLRDDIRAYFSSRNEDSIE